MWTHVVEVQGHGGAWAALGRFGTSFYILAAVFLSTQSTLKRPNEPFLLASRKRAKRLLIPFALWSAIYAAYYAAVALPLGASLSELTTWWGPFAGTARHLWFLPFAFTAGTIASIVAPRLMTLSTRTLIATALAASALFYWFCYRIAFFALDRYWAISWRLHRMDRWIEEIPLMVVAIFATALYVRLAGSRSRGELAGGELHRAWSHPPLSSQALSALPTAPSSGRLGAVLILAFLALQAIYLEGYEFFQLVSKTEGRFVANAAGISLLGSFLAMGPRPWMRALAPLGRLTYFAFLAHVLFIDLFNGEMTRLPGYGTLAITLLSTMILFVVTVLLGAVARKYKALRWLIP